jgi:hypothetical protein
MEDLVEFRKDSIGPGEDLDGNPWIMANVTGDLIIMAFHCIFWNLILTGLEYGLA